MLIFDNYILATLIWLLNCEALPDLLIMLDDTFAHLVCAKNYVSWHNQLGLTHQFIILIECLTALLLDDYFVMLVLEF